MSDENNTFDEFDVAYKIIVLGDSGVGKTNLISRYSKDQFNIETKSTVGVEFSAKQVIIEGQRINARIWDTAGQERFRAITSSFYRGAVGALLVYDITKKSSFENIGKWLQEIQGHASAEITLMLVGNKNDLDHLRGVQQIEAEKYSQQMGMAFIETSAKDSSNVEEAFQQLIQQIHQQQKLINQMGKQEDKGNQIQILEQVNIKDEKKKGCC